MINIIVCVKQILDPEMPPGKFKIDPESNKVIPPEGIPLVVSPFDEQAVEAALRIKEQCGAKITVVTVGESSAVNAVKHSLAMGADEGIVVEHIIEGYDSLLTAYILTKAIEEIVAYDLIICGREAADWGSGQVGSIIAESLGIPVVARTRKIEVMDSRLKVEHIIEDGDESLELPMPAVITVSYEIGQARIPTGWGVISAARKKIPSWSLEDIGVDLSQIGDTSSRIKLLKLFTPTRERGCQIIEGKTAAEAAANLALRLREAKVI